MNAGIHPAHFNELIDATLTRMGPQYNSPSARTLLGLTAAHESNLGRFLRQHRNGVPAGPAIGPYQMEPGRWADTVERWSMATASAVRMACSRQLGDVMVADMMAWDLRYATAMARAAYWLIPEKLPAADDLDGLADYWHRHWCRGCRGTAAQAVSAYYKFYPKEES